MSPKTDSDRAFVLGLDGIPWNLIEKWTAAGELPNFSRLVEEGAAGPMKSTMPPVTALAWPTIATGVWPDKHGIYSFDKLSREHTQSMTTSADMRQPELWDILSPSLVGNVPMTYPAQEIDGKMVTGMMTPALNDRYTHPRSLADDIAERIPEYQIGLRWKDYYGKREEFVEDITSLVEARRKLLRLFMEEEDWRLFFFVFTAPDRFQHLIWEEALLLEHYRLLDDVLGEVMEYVADLDANLFVVSDHGFGPIEKKVAVNTLLEREGYLKRKDDGARGVLSKLGLTKERVLGALDRVGIGESFIVNNLPRSLVDSVAEQVPGGHEMYDIDYGETVAFLHGAGCVYINDTRRFENGVVAPEDVDEVKKEVMALLANLTDPETGERVLEVADGDEVFRTDPDSGDIAIWGTDDYDLQKSLSDEIFVDAGGKAAGHRPEGIFMAWGPDVEPGSAPSAATVADFAPTVLHSLGEAVPNNADGRVLNEVFAPDSRPGMHAIASRDYSASGAASKASTGEDDFDDVEERLKGLGYM